MGRVKTLLCRFGSWWWSELKSLIPTRISAWMAPPRSKITFELQGHKIVARGLGLHEEIEIGSLIQPSGQSIPKDLNIIRKLLRTGASAEFALPPSNVMRFKMPLPRAAEENLGQVVRYDIDRYVPFSADEVYIDYKRLETTPDGTDIQVDVIAIPKALLDQILSRLRSLDIELDRISFGKPSEEAFNLLPNNHRRSSRHFPKVAAMTTVTAALAAVSLYLPLRSLDETSDRLTRELAGLRTQAKEASDLRIKIDGLASAKKTIAAEKSQKRAAVQTLNDITTLLPDSVWLYQLQINGRNIAIQGYAPAAQDLIPLIENSGLFRDATFQSRLTREPGSNLERFHLVFVAEDRAS